MKTFRFSTQCNVRQCFQCHGETEYYCNTCKYDLCLQCKERHVIDLDTIYHDVFIYREKYEDIQNQENCVRHPDSIYEKYCPSCELPLCLQCTKHRKHSLLDIRTAYKTNRQQQRDTINNVRSETIYNICFLFAGIQTELKTRHTEIFSRHSAMATKAMRLKRLIDNVIYYVKSRHKKIIYILRQQQIEMNKHLGIIENHEHRSESSGKRPVQFLLFIKKTSIIKKKDTLNLIKHSLLFPTEEIKRKDLIKLLSEIQVTETGKRQVRNKCLKLMSTPVLHRSFSVTGINQITHISCVTSDRVWLSDWHYNNFILIETSGETLLHLSDIKSYYGAHTVNITCDLIYVDRDNNIRKLSKDYKTNTVLIKKTEPWRPQCVYCSISNGDLLVGIYNTDTGKVNRYKYTGEKIRTVEHNNTGEKLYTYPRYITENHNGDVIVSDLYRGVVVTEHGGRYRFNYTGPPSGSRLEPRGICTDALSHILVSDENTSTIQMIDKDGHFLSIIQIQQEGIYGPLSLSYYDKAHLLWVASSITNRVYVFRYINRIDCPIDNYN